LDADQQTRWEVTNYIVALLVPLVIYLYWRQRRLNEEPIALLSEAEIASHFNSPKPEKTDNPEEDA